MTKSEKNDDLIVVGGNNLGSETFVFPEQGQDLEVPMITITDMANGTIRFATLQS
jgi:hypothetical protein